MLWIPRITKNNQITKLQKEKQQIETEIEAKKQELQEIKNTRELYCWENSILTQQADEVRDSIATLDNRTFEIDGTLIQLLNIKTTYFEENDNDLTWVVFDNSWLRRTNSEGKRHKLYNLQGLTVEQRTKSLLQKFGIGNTYDSWNKYGKEAGIKPELAVCIAFADTSLWQALKTDNNIGNIWNNDRGDRVAFDSIDSGIKAIFTTLNNQYLKQYDTLWMLSQGGRTILQAKWCWEAGEYCYATSEENWNVNVVNCLNLLYWNDVQIDENFIFRL